MVGARLRRRFGEVSQPSKHRGHVRGCVGVNLEDGPSARGRLGDLLVPQLFRGPGEVEVARVARTGSSPTALSSHGFVAPTKDLDDGARQLMEKVGRNGPVE